MKTLFATCLALSLLGSLRAQDASGSEYSPEQLDQMVGPIALYPDPLVALILPGSTNPTDIAQAAQFVAGNGDPAAIDAQSWDPSVKGLAHYPDVLKWMNDNADWTDSLGAAFSMQPADVMKSIQQLRAQAKAAGTLVDTPQQQVDVEGDDIRIVPTQPGTIYVPQYDPDEVYDASGGDPGSYVTFGVGYPVGAWLGFECNWDDFGIWVGPWHPGWGYRRDWRDGRPGGRTWHPDPRRGHDIVRNFYRPGATPPRPRFTAPARGPARGPVVGFHPQPSPSEPRPNFRGYVAPGPARPSTPAPSSPLFGGYNRGTQARDFSTRGQQSRQAPVRSAPASHAEPARSAPARNESPASDGRGRH